MYQSFLSYEQLYQINGRPLIHNTPPWVSIEKRMCIVKTLLEKNIYIKDTNQIVNTNIYIKSRESYINVSIISII